MQKLPVFEPYLLGTEKDSILSALLEKNISGTSPVIKKFETEFSHYLNSQYSVAVCNGTAALHLALLALKVKPGDEIIVPNSTIISNALAVILCEATPVFVDVDAHNWCLDTHKISDAITPKTVGIMAVHLFGHPCDMDALKKIAERHQLWILEDAAQAQGAKWRGQNVGTLTQIGTYSFYANKLITTGEGGAVTTQSKELYERLLLLRNLGFDPNPEKRFIHSEFANNFRMSGVQAAMGLAQVCGVKELEGKRKKISEMYEESFSKISGIRVQKKDARCEPVFWMSAICLEEDIKISVPELASELMKVGIETRRFFYPLNKQPALKGKHFQEHQHMPMSEKLFDRGIYLPSSSYLSWEDVQRVVKELERLLH